jgi:DNA-binding response OmpR family regulator
MKEKKVLIIDDEADFGLIMKKYFSKKGFKVFTADTISGGLEILSLENPDYILLDNNLPDGFGWSETDFILKNYPNTKLTLISGLEGPMTTAATFQILYKPIVSSDLNKIFN